MDLIFHKKSGTAVIVTKVKKLLTEISEHPFTRTGRPEALKHDFCSKWSRRINQAHRLVYGVFEHEVIIKIHAAKGHYF